MGTERPLLVGGDINGQVDWLSQESPRVHAPGVSNITEIKAFMPKESQPANLLLSRLEPIARGQVVE
ncbi:MAG: hypothetical protein HC786_33445 [Richelia sp. CSU_2_1]|nr:hypothetical protein [Microcoleus sp. SM1_3_4]NJR26651.1 hypothetical protein [Richelia sp. CSU_2_1]